ncbi:unnamed protein product, partial [Laminaria digitata]
PSLPPPSLRKPIFFPPGSKAAARGRGDTAHGPLVVGFDAIGDLVLELRRQFGHLAVFFSPGSAGSAGMIGVVWRPSAFVPRPYNANKSRHMMVAGGEGGEGGEGGVGGGGGGGGGGAGGGVLVSMNVVEVLAEIKMLGGDMLESMHVS